MIKAQENPKESEGTLLSSLFLNNETTAQRGEVSHSWKLENCFSLVMIIKPQTFDLWSRTTSTSAQSFQQSNKLVLLGKYVLPILHICKCRNKNLGALWLSSRDKLSQLCGTWTSGKKRSTMLKKQLYVL